MTNKRNILFNTIVVVVVVGGGGGGGGFNVPFDTL